MVENRWNGLPRGGCRWVLFVVVGRGVRAAALNGMRGRDDEE